MIIIIIIIITRVGVDPPWTSTAALCTVHKLMHILGTQASRQTATNSGSSDLSRSTFCCLGPLAKASDRSLAPEP